jgi:plasmid stabilization system protein ParE
VSRPEFSAEALADLAAYWAYVAADRGEQTATRVVRKIVTAIDRLGVMPTMGRERPEIAVDVRSLNLPYRQIAYYRIAGTSKRPLVLVARVLHGGMDPEQLVGAVDVSRS